MLLVYQKTTEIICSNNMEWFLCVYLYECLFAVYLHEFLTKCLLQQCWCMIFFYYSIHTHLWIVFSHLWLFWICMNFSWFNLWISYVFVCYISTVNCIHIYMYIYLALVCIDTYISNIFFSVLYPKRLNYIYIPM